MREVWLRTNRRALMFGMVPPSIVAALGAWLVFAAGPASSSWLRWVGLAVMLAGVGLVAVLAAQFRRPRIAYQDGQVLFYLRSGGPIAVPVKLVEAFFLGQGPLVLPGHRHRPDVTVNLVARISQRDPAWNRQEVKPALGQWCDSYVTIRGTWCERLDGELIRRLNRRLREVSEVLKP